PRLKSSKIETKLANIGVRAGHISSNATLKERPYDQSILEAKMKTNTTLAGWYSSMASCSSLYLSMDQKRLPQSLNLTSKSGRTKSCSVFQTTWVWSYPIWTGTSFFSERGDPATITVQTSRVILRK